MPPEPQIDEAMIECLVHRFYERIREDAMLGPIFARAIPGDWAPHLAKMVDFWSSVTMKSARYKGQPVPKHVALEGLTAAHFAHWLDLFGKTAREFCPAPAADIFIAKAEMIARSLELAVAQSRGMLDLSGDGPTAPQFKAISAPAQDG